MSYGLLVSSTKANKLMTLLDKENIDFLIYNVEETFKNKKDIDFEFEFENESNWDQAKKLMKTIKGK